MSRVSAPQQASQLRVSVARLARRLRQEGSHDENATPSQLTALATLYRNGSMTLGALARSERVKPPSMTRVVAALEERGLVRREASADDARVVLVSPTEEGLRAHEEYSKRRDAWLALQLAKLTSDERGVLRQASDILDRIADPDGVR